MIELLFITILCNFIFGLKNYRALLNPITVFTLGFLISSIVCLFYKEEWELSTFHLNSYLVIGGGITFFSFICWITKLKYKQTYITQNIVSYNYDIKEKWLYFFIVINIIIQIYTYKTIASYGGNLDITEAIHVIDQESKYSETEFKLPFLLGNFRFLFECISYYLMFLAVRRFLNKRYDKIFVFLIIYITITFFGNFLSGSRNGSMSMITYSFVCYFILLAKGKKKSILSLKGIIKYVVLGIAALTIFVKSTEWVGRDYSDFGSLYYLSFYCGAEIKNLDIYLNEDYIASENFGEFTFHNESNRTKMISSKINQFRWVGNYMLGNVYTTFQNYYQDFGLVGVFVCVGIMAFIMQLLYMRAMNSIKLKSSMFDFNIFIYGYLCRALVMSFFSERFYNSFDKGFLKFLIEIIIISFIVNKWGKNLTT